MVAKHQNALQAQKEDHAMDTMVVMLPQLGPTVKAMALKEAGFSVDDAAHMLQMFQSQNSERLVAIQRVCV
jgi:hypothetical protein